MIERHPEDTYIHSANKSGVRITISRAVIEFLVTFFGRRFVKAAAVIVMCVLGFFGGYKITGGVISMDSQNAYALSEENTKQHEAIRADTAELAKSLSDQRQADFNALRGAITNVSGEVRTLTEKLTERDEKINKMADTVWEMNTKISEIRGEVSRIKE